MKKNVVILLTAVLLGGILLFGAGCKKQAAPAASKGAGTPAAATGKKLSDGKTTFTMFVGDLGSLVSSYDYKDNKFTQKIVDETGINLQIIASSGADAVQRLNVLLSTGDYPDLIIRPLSGSSYALTMADLAFYAKEGIFISLDQYDPMSYPNIKAAFDEYPALNDILRGPDGKLYALPTVNECVHCRYGNNNQLYYQPFMQKYTQATNKAIPATLDEFTTYLRWVRDNDVNGNGKKDEIPLAFDVNTLRNAVETFAKCYMPFVNANGYFGLARNGKQAIEQYKDPRFRDTLKYMAGIYKEKLIYPDSFTQPSQAMQALVSVDPAVVAVALTSAVNRQGTDYYYHARWLPVLKGPTGEQHSYDVGPWSVLSAGMNITDKCKDPKLAISFYNYLLTFDVELTGYLGPKGYGWDDADPGALSLGGGPAKYKTLKTYGTADINYTWSQIHPMVRNYNFRYSEQANDVPTVQKWLETGDNSLLDAIKANKSYNEIKNIVQAKVRIPFATPVETLIPPLAMEEADTKRIGDINAVLNTTLDQAMVQFVTGAKDIKSDAAWNTFLADMDRVGSKEKAAIIEKYLK